MEEDEMESWSVSFRNLTRFWVQYVFVPLVTLFGVLGNIVTIRVLTRKQMRVSSNIYLCALAISDTVFLTFSFSMAWKHYELMKSVRLYWNYIPVGLWITDASGSTSVWLIVSFTIERCLAVCQPLLMRVPRNANRSVLVCVVVYILCFISTATTPFEWKTTSIAGSMDSQNYENMSAFETSSTETTDQFVLKATDLGNDACYRFVYHWFSTITFIIIPFIVLAVGNMVLIKNLRSSSLNRDALITYQAFKRRCREERITVTLIAVIIVQLVCQMPTGIVLIYTSVHTPTPGSAEDNVLLGLGNIFNLLVSLNASINFVLYTALSSNYRRIFMNIFCLSSGSTDYQNKRQANLFRIQGGKHAVTFHSSLIVHPGSSPRRIRSSSAECWSSYQGKIPLPFVLDSSYQHMETSPVINNLNCMRKLSFELVPYTIPRQKPKVEKETKSG